jgi:LysR family glycine cleavage system transcriptional activator
VKKLEQYLGVELFSRESRGVVLTAAGQEYYVTVRAALDRIADGTALILAPHEPGIVTVQVYSTFATRWLIPRLRRFQVEQPKVHVRLHTSQSDVNFEHEDVDLCVMIGQPAQANVNYDYLFSSRIFPVCSPALLRGSPGLKQPRDLAQHTLLQVYPSKRDWSVWLEHMQITQVNPGSGQQLDSYELAWNTAIQGLGVALGMEPLVNRDLASGVLVEPFPGHRTFTEGDWYLACRSEKSDLKKVRLFREWLLQQVAADPDMHRGRQLAD